ncbi:MAG: cell envelope integrity protein CreD [Candidatus Eisenbacteria bacterium]|uniref:Cell envelope integrity protein CreD n=1 Tax=Eiseniibacteriota bacterium TaxID=2212470 RepID=A0A538U172_UNCEI|nr:MAG: cell envelope integrity protein CreD [Candidatus Eisenbacteria bacterium]
MRNQAVVKLFVLSLLLGLSLIPLGLIWGVVADRARYRDRVVGDVAQSSARAQLLFGPILVIETPTRRIGSASDSTVHRQERVVLPESLNIGSDVRVESRQRGIYRVPVYRAMTHLRATFATPAPAEVEPGYAAVGPARARLAFGVSDPRGLRVVPIVRLGDTPLPVSPQTDLAWVGPGFSAALDLPGGRPSWDVDARLELTGTDHLGFVPLGANTDVTMDGDWPHPGFTGGFSPDERRIAPKGFHARWRVSRFATGVPSAIAARERVDQFGPQGNDLSVRFVQPVDVYQQSERAVKYGILFVALTFVAFFLFETLRRLAIHPIQYGLVAAALAIFFLLLVSLSEHLPFAMAYGVAGGACAGLLTFYTGHMLGSSGRGIGFGALLATLYGLLYVILQSEDYALLLGALLLFGALGVVMIATRRVNWYRLNEAPTGGS